MIWNKKYNDIHKCNSKNFQWLFRYLLWFTDYQFFVNELLLCRADLTDSYQHYGNTINNNFKGILWNRITWQYYENLVDIRETAQY